MNASVKMKYVWIQSVVYLLVQYNPVQGSEICEFDDEVCLTKGVDNLFKKTVVGVPCLVEPSDPIFIKEVEGKILDTDYLISNITLEGFKNCSVIQMSLNETAMTYQHTLRCPKLIVDYNFNAIGNLLEAEIDGIGNAVITTGVYEITISGKYGQFISKEDQKPHLYLITYCIKTNAIGRLVFESDDLNKDKEKAKQALIYLNENCGILVDFFRQPVMKESLRILMAAVNKYLRTLPIDEVFPKID